MKRKTFFKAAISITALSDLPYSPFRGSGGAKKKPGLEKPGGC